MEQLKIFNGFGIKPTRTYTAAGMDFYLPYLKSDKEKELALDAFKNSYKVSEEDIYEIQELILDLAKYKDNFFDYDVVNENIINIIMLFLGLDSIDVNYDLTDYRKRDLYGRINYFLHNYLTFDDKNRPGIKVRIDDHIFFNSGIKVALNPGTAGIFFNKSGMGNKGFDVRACVVDEDYSGYVHISMAFTKNNFDGQPIYCGDKLTQMLIFDIHNMDADEISEDEYNEIMKDSKRGNKGFGSSDVK